MLTSDLISDKQRYRNFEIIDQPFIPKVMLLVCQTNIILSEPTEEHFYLQVQYVVGNEDKFTNDPRSIVNVYDNTFSQKHNVRWSAPSGNIYIRARFNSDLDGKGHNGEWSDIFTFNRTIAINILNVPPKLELIIPGYRSIYANPTEVPYYLHIQYSDVSGFINPENLYDGSIDNQHEVTWTPTKGITQYIRGRLTTAASGGGTVGPWSDTFTYPISLPEPPTTLRPFRQDSKYYITADPIPWGYYFCVQRDTSRIFSSPSTICTKFPFTMPVSVKGLTGEVVDYILNPDSSKLLYINSITAIFADDTGLSNYRWQLYRQEGRFYDTDDIRNNTPTIFVEKLGDYRASWVVDGVREFADNYITVLPEGLSVNGPSTKVVYSTHNPRVGSVVTATPIDTSGTINGYHWQVEVGGNWVYTSSHFPGQSNAYHYLPGYRTNVITLKPDKDTNFLHSGNRIAGEPEGSPNHITMFDGQKFRITWLRNGVRQFDDGFVELGGGLSKPTVRYSNPTPDLNNTVRAHFSFNTGISTYDGAFRWQVEINGNWYYLGQRKYPDSYTIPPIAETVWSSRRITHFYRVEIKFEIIEDNVFVYGGPHTSRNGNRFSALIYGQKFRITWIRDGVREVADEYVVLTDSTGSNFRAEYSSYFPHLYDDISVTLYENDRIVQGNEIASYQWQHKTNVGEWVDIDYEGHDADEVITENEYDYNIGERYRITWIDGGSRIYGKHIDVPARITPYHPNLIENLEETASDWEATYLLIPDSKNQSNTGIVSVHFKTMESLTNLVWQYYNDVKTFFDVYDGTFNTTTYTVRNAGDYRISWIRNGVREFTPDHVSVINENYYAGTSTKVIYSSYVARANDEITVTFKDPTGVLDRDQSTTTNILGGYLWQTEVDNIWYYLVEMGGDNNWYNALRGITGYAGKDITFTIYGGLSYGYHDIVNPSGQRLSAATRSLEHGQKFRLTWVRNGVREFDDGYITFITDDQSSVSGTPSTVISPIASGGGTIVRYTKGNPTFGDRITGTLFDDNGVTSYLWQVQVGGNWYYTSSHPPSKRYHYLIGYTTDSLTLTTDRDTNFLHSGSRPGYEPEGSSKHISLITGQKFRLSWIRNGTREYARNYIKINGSTSDNNWINNEYGYLDLLAGETFNANPTLVIYSDYFPDTNDDVTATFYGNVAGITGYQWQFRSNIEGWVNVNDLPGRNTNELEVRTAFRGTDSIRYRLLWESGLLDVTSYGINVPAYLTTDNEHHISNKLHILNNSRIDYDPSENTEYLRGQYSSEPEGEGYLSEWSGVFTFNKTFYSEYKSTDIPVPGDLIINQYNIQEEPTHYPYKLEIEYSTVEDFSEDSVIISDNKEARQHSIGWNPPYGKLYLRARFVETSTGRVGLWSDNYTYNNIPIPVVQAIRNRLYVRSLRGSWFATIQISTTSSFNENVTELYGSEYLEEHLINSNFIARGYNFRARFTTETHDNGHKGEWSVPTGLQPSINYTLNLSTASSAETSSNTGASIIASFTSLAGITEYRWQRKEKDEGNDDWRDIETAQGLNPVGETTKTLVIGQDYAHFRITWIRKGEREFDVGYYSA